MKINFKSRDFRKLLHTIPMLIIILLQSCGEPDYIKISNMNVNVQRITGQEARGYYQTLFLTTDSYLSGTETPAIRYDSLAFGIFSDFYFAQTNPPGSFFFSSAYAKRAEIYEKIVELMIVSDKDYNWNMKAGDNLAAAMLAHEGFLAQGKPIALFLETFRSNDPFTQILLTMEQSPDSTRFHHFTMSFITENSKRFDIEIGGLLILAVNQ
jgi:hypothetical protein